jgi:ribulose-phosphate 3-epimerase
MMINNLQIKLAPSILSADFSRLGEQVAEVVKAGSDWIHIDVMDGHFVPNITIGAPVVKALRPWTDLPFDVHLMVTETETQIPQFAAAGADIITVHAEVCPHLHRVVESIRQLNIKAGVALNPGSPLALVDDILPFVDLVLLMTVDPGSGGQVFIEEMMAKIARLRRKLDEEGLGAELEVDGGITAPIAPKVVRAGARVLVTGAAIFNSGEGIKKSLQRLKSSL